MGEKIYVALIYTVVARLREVQIKGMGDTVTTIETKPFVKTLRDALIRMKSRCRTTRSITRYQRRRSRHLVTHLPQKERGTFAQPTDKTA